MGLSLRNYTSDDNEMAILMLETQTSEDMTEEKMSTYRRRAGGFFSSPSPLGR